ncbi:MAG TPA: fatty acyl-AMP ligase, partial [Labilithrix sp.]|nr:fatty acyl-AMP ligase [Labilithrix sp.]
MGHASEPKNLVDMLLRRADSHGDETLYRYLETGDVDGPITTMSYNDLLRRAKAVGALLQRLGGAGERAMLLYPPGLDFMAGIYGCFFSGTIAVPTFSPDPTQKERLLKRFAVILADARPRFVLTTRAFAEMAPAMMHGIDAAADVRWITTDDLDESLADEWTHPVFDGDPLALLQYTSGSTSAPKGVMVSHANLIDNQQRMADVSALGPGYNTVYWLPLFHDLGLLCGVIVPVCQAHVCTLMSPVVFLQKPVRWLQAVSHFRATATAGPNFAFGLVTRKVTDDEIASLDLSSLLMCGNGAEPVTGSTLRMFIDRFVPAGLRPHCLSPMYGLAEATLMVTATASEAPYVSVFLSGEELKRGKVEVVAPDHPDAKELMCLGRPGEGIEILIVNPDTLTRAAPDEVGEIWVQSPEVGRGYWNKPEETARGFSARLSDTHKGPYLRTGDLGFLHEGMVCLTGRHKDLLIVRGANFYPQDIEATVEHSSRHVRPGCVAAFTLAADKEEHLVVCAEAKTPGEHGPSLADIARGIRVAVAEAHGVHVHAVALLA